MNVKDAIIDAHERAATAEAARDEALDMLVEMVNQHAVSSDDGVPNTVQTWLHADADAVRMLVKHGRMELVSGDGRYLVARWKR